MNFIAQWECGFEFTLPNQNKISQSRNVSTLKLFILYSIYMVQWNGRKKMCHMLLYNIHNVIYKYQQIQLNS